jgi:hypothetical protein
MARTHLMGMMFVEEDLADTQSHATCTSRCLLQDSLFAMSVLGACWPRKHAVACHDR